jgi:hypothetical protein
MKALAVVVLALAAAGCATHPPSKRVIVLGVDGMDPEFLERHWDALPHLRQLRDEGGLARLATTTPPQSPVAWSTFITGLDPEQHGIFDFVRRDPSTGQPVSSFAESLPPRFQLAAGPYVLPLSPARVRLLRRGTAFWELLAARGIPVTLMRLPVNYPPLHAGEALAGMGTPDLEGTFGTFTYYTDDPLESPGEVPGGRIIGISLDGQRVRLPIDGPPNPLRRDGRLLHADALVDIDPDAGAFRCRIDNRDYILKLHEWSPWMRVRFPIGPGSITGIFRLYAKELSPAVRIYRSPLNIDPADPALPISTPSAFARELEERIGPYGTLGIREDTAAVRQNVLTREEYLEQSRLIFAEDQRMLADCLERFRGGLLFFYFSEVDQNSHLLWGQFENELLHTYQQVDRAVGLVRERAPDARLIIMSDHGFTSFEKSVNLNTWLSDQGYGDRSRAMGLNALYVKPGAEHDRNVAEIASKLRELRDPVTGAPVVEQVAVHPTEPAITVGYARGYRASWETGLGEAPATGIIQVNSDAWIGDHCMAAGEVPGVLLGTRRPVISNPGLKDLPVTILGEYGIRPAEGMTGRRIYGE